MNINDFNGLSKHAKWFEGVRIQCEVTHRPMVRNPQKKREAG